jgi:aminoglycoside 3-N-acetyltransferase
MASRRLKTLTRIDLERDIRKAGVLPGDTLVVHSSLSAVGWVLGGPDAVIDSFLTVLGDAGTLVMPTFTFNLTAWGMAAFDPRSTPSRVGLLTDTFWRRRGVLRSEHPTHSVAAIGPAAGQIVAGPVDYEPLGLGSPLDRVRQLGGRILLLGVGQNRNSTIHVAESIAQVPYFAVRFNGTEQPDEAWYVDGRGRRQLVLIEEMPGSSEGFVILDAHLESNGVATKVQIGEAQSWLMESEAVCRDVARALLHDSLLLLPPVSTSDISRRRRSFTEEVIRRRRPAPVASHSSSR